MAIKTAAGRNAASVAYGNLATHGAIYTTAPGATAGTEPTGVYARKPLTWGAPSDNGTVSTITATATFDVPSGATITGVGLHTALTAGNYVDGGTVTSQNFASQGTLTVTYTYQQS